MATYKIPNSQGQIRQNNRSETFGELLETFNIDLNKKFGKINTSKKLLKVLDEDTDLGSDNVEALTIYDDDYYLATDSDLFTCAGTDDPTDSSNWSEVTEITSALSTKTDLAVFGGLLLMTSGGNIFSWDGATFDNDWDNGKISSISDASQMYVHRGGQETLFVLDENVVRYYNATAGTKTITLQDDLTATCVTGGVNAVWVGTQSSSGSNAYVYEIYTGEVLNVTDENGVVVDTIPVARNAYKVEGTTVMSIEVVDNIPHIVTEKGNLQAFNGAGFSTVTSFPFANTTETISKNAVHPKGMKLHNDSLFINIATERRATTLTDYVPDCPSGVWEYNRITGQLNHRFGFVDSDSDNGALEINNAINGPIQIIDNEYALMLVGAEVGAISSNTSGMFADTGSQWGYFKTVEMESGTVQDAFERLYIKAKTLASGESITVKYRSTKKDSVFCDGAYAETGKFNTTDDISAITANSDGTYDWDVTDIHTGLTAHVTNISQSSSTYEIETDGTVGTIGEQGRIEFQNWTNVSDSYTTDDGEVKSWGSFGTAPWIQFKVILNGAIELRQFLLKSNSKQEV